jgi:hypothetical protein
MSIFLRYGIIEHPTFGRVPRVITLVDLPAGTELSVHYMIDIGDTSADLGHIQWYVDLWEKSLTNGGSRSRSRSRSKSRSRVSSDMDESDN